MSERERLPYGPLTDILLRVAALRAEILHHEGAGERVEDDCLEFPELGAVLLCMTEDGDVCAWRVDHVPDREPLARGESVEDVWWRINDALRVGESVSDSLASRESDTHKRVPAGSPTTARIVDVGALGADFTANPVEYYVKARATAPESEAERLACYLERWVSTDEHLVSAARLLRELTHAAEWHFRKQLDAQAEVARLREALEEIGGPFENGDTYVDMADFQDTLERLGVLVEVPASEEFREAWDADTMFVWAWSPAALASKEERDG